MNMLSLKSDKANAGGVLTLEVDWKGPHEGAGVSGGGNSRARLHAAPGLRHSRGSEAAVRGHDAGDGPIDTDVQQGVVLRQPDSAGESGGQAGCQ